MKTATATAALVLSSLLGPAAAPASDDLPKPDADRVKYARPQDYVDVAPSLGNPERIRTIAAGLKSDSAERTLLNVGHWVDENLTCDPKAAYEWRDFDGLVDGKVYGGCADHALVFGALARACGIPTVWVKTMDADWIREFRQNGTCTTWRGHVFLEVFVRDKWRLLDASGKRLYDDYDPAARVLPGTRYAYDKGGDPKALILSTDWERWQRQTAAHFVAFDLSKLPVPVGRQLGTVYVAADSPVWQALAKKVKDTGLGFFSFNAQFDKFLPEARGGDLIITSVADSPVLPLGYRAEFLPIPTEEIAARLAKEPKGQARKTLPDGTRVTLIFGKNLDALLEAVAEYKVEFSR